ncbi:hypothetical protein G6F42_022743 [Rhizopus arrhizus]|nr:hypothetical protein G6F42_022743 [Rhizopus arrhizus]
MRGRVTVLNSLVLSKLWHVLRLVTFTPSEFASLQSIISSFVNRNTKLTRLSFDTLTSPRTLGGLKLLNPAQKCNALQWRWLQPLLHPDQPSPFILPSLPILRTTLSFVLGSVRFPSYHWSLLFPPCRPSGLPDFGPVYNIMRAHLLPPFHPLTPTFSPPSTILQNHITIRLHLYGSDIFDYNPTTLTLDLKQTFRNLPHPTSSSRAITMIRNHTLLLNTFALQAMIPYFPDHSLPPPNSTSPPLHPLIPSIPYSPHLFPASLI